MQLIRGLHNIRPAHRNCVATIGNFDGVHRGHRAILGALFRESRKFNAKTCVITFEPLPWEHFSSSTDSPSRLTTLREKLFLLRQSGVDQVLCLPFGERLSRISARDFVETILVRGLGVSYLIVGDDFRFGYGRKGDFHQLCAMGQHYGFKVSDTRTVAHDCARISSTRIRALLASGQLSAAAELLGQPFMIMGRVRPGQRLGRTLGFPTANITVRHRTLPMGGVFAVRVMFGGQVCNGVANLGVRPTVAVPEPLLEVHLLDFNGDLYGKLLRVEFMAKIRSEQKFASLEALRTAIAGDVAHARQILTA